ncbi:DNA cytosine methyltransferase [Stygiolobus caldivivus]|uniref:DNA (cytosine-5-)-methyltransferase n=1 Tax=Stygiolobus caldivivus TaxID=2824673 RepID=A0A8D5U7E6_9CREN|nr:DNA cytosine methyltransferase [Stygiolobus caldivivus]BCU70602.1 restriction endonuclease subunit M [Stygiolobus caldivivus]
MGRITIIDLFSGAGGFSLGFRKAGFIIRLAVDINHAAARTYSLNFPHTIVVEDDIRNLTGKDIRYLVGDDIQIVIGSPPCEPYTGANPLRMREPLDRLYLDERGELTLEYIRMVGELSPKIFVMENVPSIANTESLREAIKLEFRRVGYEKIFFNYLKAEDYGNPSKRTRVFISNIPLNPPKLKRRTTVWDAINDLSDPKMVNAIPNHEIQEVNERKMKDLAKTEIDDYITMFRGSSGRNIPLYIRLNPNKLAPTVLGNSKFIHPYESRFLTVREQARLMSYPDFHVFLGNKDEQYNQVGEAVPVALSTAIARQIMSEYYA